MGGPNSLSSDMSDLSSSDGMNSAALMSMLHDGSLDMNALFHSDTAVFTSAGIGGSASAGGQQRSSSNGFDGTFSPGSASAMMGLVSTP